MEASKRKALEAAGWKVGDAADFLEMSDDERQLLDARVQLAQAVRRMREARQLTQKKLGEILKTTQPRVAKIELAAPDVSMDQLVRAFTSVGGRIRVKMTKARASNKSQSRHQAETLVLEMPVPQ